MQRQTSGPVRRPAMCPLRYARVAGWRFIRAIAMKWSAIQATIPPPLRRCGVVMTLDARKVFTPARAANAASFSLCWLSQAADIHMTAAMRVATGPLSVPVLAAVFGFVSAVGGILLAIMGTLPVSPYITTISFVIYLVCRGIGARRGRVTRERVPA